MNSSFRIAFWTLSIALGLPLALFIAAVVLPIDRSHLVAWHEGNPQWGLHRGENQPTPQSLTPAQIKGPASRDRAAAVMVAESEQENLTDADSSPVQHDPAGKPPRIAAVTLDAENPPTTSQRRTLKAPVSLTAKERPASAKKKAAASPPFSEDSASPGKIDQEEGLPDPDSRVQRPAARAVSGPQIGDTDVSTEETPSIPVRRNPASERRTVEFRAGSTVDELQRNESLNQEKLQLEAQLVSLQQSLDQLTQLQLSQAREQQQLAQLQQAAQLAEQLQQQSSVTTLERQVQSLQTALDEIRKSQAKPAPQPPVPAAARTISEPFPEAVTSKTPKIDKPVSGAVSKVYRPQYISARDLQPAVTPLLTPGTGRLSIAAASPGNKTADGNPIDPHAQRDGLLVSDLPDALQQIDEVIAKMDVPPPQVDIEATIYSVQLSEAQRNGLDLNALSENVPGSGYNSTGAGCGPNGCVTPAPANAGLRWTRLRGNARQFVNNLEQLGPTQLVAHPRVVVLNRQQACLTIGHKSPYRAASQGSPTSEMQNIEAGARLQVRPFVAQDGMVRMELQPAAGSVPLAQLALGENAEVVTRIVIPEGETIVIGGFIEEQSLEKPTANRRRIFASLPWSKEKTGEQRTAKGTVVRSELIVLITPRIVRDSGTSPVAGAPQTIDSEPGLPVPLAISSHPSNPRESNTTTAEYRKSPFTLVPTGLAGAKGLLAKPAATSRQKPPSPTATTARPSSISDLPSLDELPDPDSTRNAKPASVGNLGKTPAPKLEAGRPAFKATPREPVTFLPMPSESEAVELKQTTDAAARSAKPGTTPVSSKHPYSRIGLSLDPEEQPGLAPPDSDGP